MDTWKLLYSEYKPEEELLREALCTTGNGYFASRGAWEGSPGGDKHYHGTYLAGGYNRLETKIAGRLIENEDLVNWPDWTVLKLKPETGTWLDPDVSKLLEYEEELNLKEGILSRRLLFEDEEQRQTEIISRRMVCMNNKHLAAIEWRVVPKNWSGKVVIHSALDGSVLNTGVKRYRDLSHKHLKKLDLGGFKEDCIFLKVMSSQSEIVMAQAARTRVHLGSYDSHIDRQTIQQEEYIAQELTFEAEENKEIRIEKILALYTSRDYAISEPLLAAKKEVRRIESFEELYRGHCNSWKEIWEESDVILKADEEEDQLLLRLHIFHLLQTYSFNSIDLDVAIPARGWHGEAYRGHIFWDELFIFPLFTIRTPELTRSLLMYRYRRLPEARYAACESGYKGAMFPWQSASNGREESQVIHLNPQSGNWVPDDTYLQRHVNAAIAYNTWKYFEITGDLEFLSFYGAEMLIEIARFWASKAEYNEERGKYEINKVVGPDEYHTHMPGSPEPGLHNNAYTNFMAVWCLVHALLTIDKLEERRVQRLMEQLEFDREETNRWDKISRNMFIPFTEEGKVIEQYEGFDKLKNLDWEKYRKDYGEILRLDRILEKEGDDINNYKAVKQADVLMLFYLFSAEELSQLFEHMGYNFDPGEQIPLNISYYQKITAHGSTLSKLVNSWVYARSRRDESWHDFKRALVSDFKDVQGGTTPEGIHLGAMAGTIDLVQRCYTGLEFKPDALHFNPQLPANVSQIKFRLRYMKHWLDVNFTGNKLNLKSMGRWDNEIKVVVKGQEYFLKKGEEITVEI